MMNQRVQQSSRMGAYLTGVEVLDCLIVIHKGNMLDPTRFKHIYWRSRRGMLELELKLVPFVRDHFETLSADEQQRYEQLLAYEDWQIFDWLQQREVPDDPALLALVQKIIASQGKL